MLLGTIKSDWYAGAQFGQTKGSRVRIPHKAVAERTPTAPLEATPGRRGPRWTPKSEYLPAYDAHPNLSEPERVLLRLPFSAYRCALRDAAFYFW